MPSWLWIVIVVLLVLATVRLLAVRTVTRGVDPTQLSLSPELAGQVQELALAGRKIEAIKLLRAGTGTSLLAAKTIVEKMSTGRPAS